MFTSIWSWLVDNAAALGIVLGAVPIVWAVIQFILIRRAEAKRVRFETYHSLIKQLVERENPDQPMRLDRQIAVIYELQNFKHYFPVSLRILKGLRTDWANYGPAEKRARLMEELDLAIAYIQKKV